MSRSYSLLVLCLLFSVSLCQEEIASEECKTALEACENDLECSNRLAPLMAACTTGTCQPQCRNAVLNVYQNKIGRTLLRSDTSCIPGREELRSCNFIPTAAQVHCSLVKLACEADLQCNSKWGVFVSECESEAARGECSAKCNGLLAAATATPHGTAFSNCTCTDKEDQLCEALRDNLIGVCNKPTPPPLAPGDNSITSSPNDAPDEVSSTNVVFPSLLLCTLFLVRLYYFI